MRQLLIMLMAILITATAQAQNVGNCNSASGIFSTAMGYNNVSRGFAGTAIGMYSSPIFFTDQTNVTSNTPLFIIGNGDNDATRSKTMVVRKDNHIGIGTNTPDRKPAKRNGTSKK